MSSQFVRPFPMETSEGYLTMLKVERTKHDRSEIDRRQPEFNQLRVLVEYSSCEMWNVTTL